MEQSPKEIQVTKDKNRGWNEKNKVEWIGGSHKNRQEREARDPTMVKIPEDSLKKQSGRRDEEQNRSKGGRGDTS